LLLILKIKIPPPSGTPFEKGRKKKTFPKKESIFMTLLERAKDIFPFSG